VSISVGYGLITCQRHPDHDQGWSPLYAEALELAGLAEQVGLDSVWVSEHHFVDDGHLPSSLVLLAAMAARTQRITLGTGLLLAPLHEPLRVIEDAAVVDQLSSGRLVLGLGLGWRDEEFEAFGVPLGERVRRTVGLVDLARSAWSGGSVEVRDGVAEPVVTPAPAQPGGPPLWIGALAEAGVRRAGRIADGFMATEVTPDELREQLAWVTQERARAGRRDPFTVALHLPTLVGVDFQDAAELLSYPGWKYEDMAEARSMAGPLRAAPAVPPEALPRLAETTLSGSEAEVADRVREYADAAGGSLHFVARSYLPGLDAAGRREAVARLAGVRARLRADA
jgi:alkanesulfonate monooxygenase SsuD/methylene tetrahydromethanopterin reductase-like flavin-dependent oxidoreductase (luciferase family)